MSTTRRDAPGVDAGVVEHLLEPALREGGQRRLAARVAEQALGRHHHQRLLDRVAPLPPQLRDGDRWLVDDVAPAPQPGIGAPDGATTTSTPSTTAVPTTATTTPSGG